MLKHESYDYTTADLEQLVKVLPEMGSLDVLVTPIPGWDQYRGCHLAKIIDDHGFAGEVVPASKLLNCIKRRLLQAA